MKIVICIKNQQYERAIKRFLNYKWRFKELIRFEASLESLQKDEIVLTDDLELFERFASSGFYLSEYHDLKERRIGKYTRFETMLQMLHPEISEIVSKEHPLKVISICSMQGGSGKSAILRHLAHYLSRDYHVCTLNLFQTSAEVSDLCEFILEYRNTRKVSNRYFYNRDYCPYIMNGFQNPQDLEGISCSEFYNSLTEFLRGRSFDMLLFDISHPFISLCKPFIEKSDYRIIVRDCRRKEDAEPGIGTSCLIVENFSDCAAHPSIDSEDILKLPYDEALFKGSGEVNENSVFYSKIRKFAQGVFHV